jgi:hypothetical protein
VGIRFDALRPNNFSSRSMLQLLFAKKKNNNFSSRSMLQLLFAKKKTLEVIMLRKHNKYTVTVACCRFFNITHKVKGGD